MKEIEIFVQNRHFLVKNDFFWPKLAFWSKIEIVEKDRNFGAKKIIFNEKKNFGGNFSKLRRKSSWHKFVAQVHGNEPRTFTMVFYHGN